MKENRKALIEFAQEIATGEGRIFKEVRRNTRWAINLIPVFGSLLDTHTFGRLEDQALDLELDKLNDLCKKALTSDEENLTTVLTSINEISQHTAAFIHHSVINASLISSKENAYILELLQRTLAALDLQPWSGKTKDFSSLLFLVAGSTCVGKDVILDAVFKSSQKHGINCELLKKYTTRKKRFTDASYYEFISKKEFNEKLNAGEIIMSYSKYGHSYGFDMEHLLSSSSQGTAVFAVYTEIWHGDFSKMISGLSNRNIATCSILLTASRQCIERRALNRNIDPNETLRRLQRAFQESDYIIENATLMEQQFNHIIDNSDKQSIQETINQIENIVWSTMRLANGQEVITNAV